MTSASWSRMRTGGVISSVAMADVLLALGYDKPRLNVHKAGREVDVLATHRTEPRVAVAECKAMKRPIGGDDLNKFAGVLERERGRDRGVAIQGYFISLAGFSERRSNRSPRVARAVRHPRRSRRRPAS